MYSSFMTKTPSFSDTTQFVLDSERFDAFVELLGNPPAPDSKLRALLRRSPIWVK
jgi:uncharacterized protein (DUF1778 family)